MNILRMNAFPPKIFKIFGLFYLTLTYGCLLRGMCLAEKAGKSALKSLQSATKKLNK